MNRKLLKHLEAQFGGNWSCACRTPFDSSRFEIISENNGSFLAHYICPVCGREQMLAASMSYDDTSQSAGLLKNSGLSSNDVLDIRAELRRAPLKKLKTLLRGTHKETSPSAADVGTLMRFSND